jgi:hypothetical protein
LLKPGFKQNIELMDWGNHYFDKTFHRKDAFDGNLHWSTIESAKSKTSLQRKINNSTLTVASK